MTLVLEIGFGIWIFLIVIVVAFIRGSSIQTAPALLPEAAEAREERLPTGAEAMRRRG
jgi:hypothetical protein